MASARRRATATRPHESLRASRRNRDGLKTVSINTGLFYEGLVVASRQGAPLTQPPAYGEASPAREHLVLYDDGSSEWLTLKNEKVRYVQATRAAQLVGQVTASLSADDDMDWFAAPVEAEALGLVDYHNVVSEPMDLGTVDNRVEIKVQVSFNSGSLGVCVRCYSLYVEEGIPRRSCPSLGRKHESRDSLVDVHTGRRQGPAGLLRPDADG